MEEKKISEQESLEIISKMIEQTKQESAIGSGNVFLIWGYLGAFISLVVFAMCYFRQEGGWGWLYTALPVLGFVAAGIVGRRMKKKYATPSTYAGMSIRRIWECLGCVFAYYAINCILSRHDPQGWTGMFLLGLLLPGIGTFCTGAILKENWVRWCGVMGTMFGLDMIQKLVWGDFVLTLKWPALMAFSMIITLVIPGHILNNKATKAKK